jgi:hypothetical protein
MNWINILNQIFQLAIFPIISIAAIYICYLISVKIDEIKKKNNNALADKYLDMLNDTIVNAVLTTTQTYVESLKKDNMFTADAQKEAFKKTYDAVMKILTEDAKKCLTESVGDLETYITNKIEAEVKLSKNLT